MSKLKVHAYKDVYTQDLGYKEHILVKGKDYKAELSTLFAARWLVKCEDSVHRWFDAEDLGTPTGFPAAFRIVPPSAPKHKVYIGGSLSNPAIVQVTKELQDAGIYAFSEWYTPGPEADVLWRDYERALGYSYKEALKRPAAVNTFNFDKRHIDECNVFLMVLPCGKSAHMELGYAIGSGKRGFILMPEEPERWDVMYGFAEAVVSTTKELINALSVS